MDTLFKTMETMELTQSEKALILESLSKSKMRSEALIEQSREWVNTVGGPFVVKYKEMYREHWATIERLTIKVANLDSIMRKLDC